MKKIIILMALSLSSSLSFAASPDALKAALTEASRSVSDITVITEIQRCRAIDCYVLKFEGSNQFGRAYVVIQTERDFTGTINTKILEQSR